jgi:hypothetical protein
MDSLYIVIPKTHKEDIENFLHGYFGFIDFGVTSHNVIDQSMIINFEMKKIFEVKPSKILGILHRLYNSHFSTLIIFKMDDDGSALRVGAKYKSFTDLECALKKFHQDNYGTSNFCLGVDGTFCNFHVFIFGPSFLEIRL